MPAEPEAERPLIARAYFEPDESSGAGWLATVGSTRHRLEPADLEVLEAFLHPGTLEQAYEVYREPWSAAELQDAHESIQPFVERARGPGGGVFLELTREVLVLGLPGQDPIELASGSLDG